ncbi:hypothetical protein [Macrococcus animalis]|uniref:hypothetical protein n=1 Tax=Macrococcus animalis TaxID=3395467 RepID=UPI0039BE0754
MIIWSLFDSGNGSYAKVAETLPNTENYSIGIDRQNQNNHFINLNLADYSMLFGKDELISTLSKLPQPDLIIASPPCESWSVASAMDRGNACWKQEQADSLFAPQTPLSKFTVRDYKDYDKYQFKPEKSLMTRVNGELTIFNTIRIIKHFKPKYYIIENPAHGRIWDYIDRVLGFKIEYENLTYYNNWDYPIKKPTKFGSNLNLNLTTEYIKQETPFREMNWNYNQRSNIPEKLVRYIFGEVERELNQMTLDEVM